MDFKLLEEEDDDIQLTVSEKKTVAPVVLDLDFNKSLSKSVNLSEKIANIQDNFVVDNAYYDQIVAMPKDVIVEDMMDNFLQEFEDYKLNINNAISVLLKKFDEGQYDKLKRVLHTFKGGLGIVGLMRVRQDVHFLEDLLKVKEGGLGLYRHIKNRLVVIIDYVDNIKIEQSPFIPYREGDGEKSIEDGEQLTRFMVSLGEINYVSEEVDFLRRLHNNFASENNQIKGLLEDLEGVISHINHRIQELEFYAETNIQSQLQTSSHGKDPLLMDNFTKLQELSRLIVENQADLNDIQNNLLRLNKRQKINLDKSKMFLENSRDTLSQMRLISFSKLKKSLENTIKIASDKERKEVDFELIDNNVRLDVTISNKINGILGHILRNSVSHGIEPKAERKKLGKPAHGLIKITAHQDANSFYLQIVDDGHGLDLAKIKKKAIEKGLIKENDPFTDKQAVDFILMKDFSTASVVNDIAGRGVGMDVIQADVLSLGGRFEIISKEGKGMTVIIEIPTKYTTNHGLVVSSKENKFVVLDQNINEVINISHQDYLDALSAQKISYKGKDFIFVDLRQLLNLPLKAIPSNHNIFLMSEGQGRTLAVAVDEILEHKEISITSLNKSFEKMYGFVGVTTLLNGEEVFVYNPLQAFYRNTQILNQEAIEHVDHLEHPLVMVVDDSPMVRKSTEKFLDKYHFRHLSAKNGEDALTKLSNASELPKVILLDIEMPIMNGFQFAEIVKSSDKYKNIPIVIISSRGNSEHMGEADKLGIEEYIVKPFIPDHLLETLKRCIK